MSPLSLLHGTKKKLLKEKETNNKKNGKLPEIREISPVDRVLSISVQFR